MKICLMCDLHLPENKSALSYDVCEWAMRDIKKEKPDCVLFAGDVTCFGDYRVYRDFIRKMQTLPMPFLYIPGNSDLRRSDTKKAIARDCSPAENTVCGIRIIAVNDCGRTIDKITQNALETADKNTVVFMHHPADELLPPYSDYMRKWLKYHTDTPIFCGHMHVSKKDGNITYLQCADPDKAMGSCAAITYYNTETEEITESFYECPVPDDIYKYIGISCYRPERDFAFAAKHGIKNTELRPNVILYDKKEILSLAEKWRKVGGEHICVHLPEIEYRDGKIINNGSLDKILKLAADIGADRFTQHVPLARVCDIEKDDGALGRIAEYLAEKLGSFGKSAVLGVENMHMVPGETTDKRRRFGYTPEECLRFMNALSSATHCKTGINFDIGHARNNAPFSSMYQISTWFAMLGKHTVGYHIHQVTKCGELFENHMPITDFYGSLISFGSFFKCWSDGRINKAPVIFEMRPENAYDVTLNTFNIGKHGQNTQNFREN